MLHDYHILPTLTPTSPSIFSILAIQLWLPPGFESEGYPNHVYKLHKALYGLKQAPRAWYECIRDFLIENGFRIGKADSTLFGLLDLKSKKECENPHHGHLKPICHYFTELITKGFVSRTKYNIVDIDLAYK
jgi:hypothetical protein